MLLHRRYDFVIIGAGLAGATFAQQATENGKTCLVIDRRNHIAGNCYTEHREGIDIHMYGPHLFHTNKKQIWDYVNRFAEFNDYHHSVLAKTAGGLYSMPINLYTLNALFGIRTPQDAIEYFRSVRKLDADETTLEGWCLKNIGKTLYGLFIRDYTEKQWNRKPSELPSFIIKRLPVRLTWDTHYFNDRYQGIPVHGYTELVQRMLDGIDVELDVDFNENREYIRALGEKVVYTGSCDELYNYDLGKLPYRSITLEHEFHDINDYQGVGQVNYTSHDWPYTRITEHKHFVPDAMLRHTIISKEYSSEDGEPYYPINTEDNMQLAYQYMQRAISDGYIVLGRLGRYQYYDMHQVIAQALMVAKEELSA